MEAEVKNLIDFLDKEKLWQEEGLGRFFDFKQLNEVWDDVPEEIQNKIENLGRCYLIQSSDGYTTYALRDIAAKIYFAREYSFDKYITFVGNEQQHHFNQVYAIISYLSSLPSFQKKYGLEVANHLKFQNLRNLFNGILSVQNQKTSTRKGNFMSVESLLNQIKLSAEETINLKHNNLNQEDLHNQSHKISIAALKWFNLNHDIHTNSTLDVQSILNFEGNTGVYQLYTYARLNSILKKNFTGKNEIEIEYNPEFWKYYNVAESNLIKITYYLPQVLETICSNYKTHILTNYLFNLATSVNSWYTKYSVNSEQDELRKQALLFMCQELKKNLGFCLDLLAIIPLEEL